MSALEAIFTAVIDTSWRAACLIVVVLGLRQWLRGRVAARVLFWVWLAVALRLLLPVSLPAAWSPFNLAPWRQDSGDQAIAPVAREAASVVGAVGEGSIVERPRAAAAGTVVLSNFRWTEWAALTWASGAVLLILARGFAYGALARRVRQTAQPAPAALLPPDVVNRLAAHRVEVVISDAVSAPALQGVFRPRILFPPGLIERLSASEIRLTVAHELAHAERRDLLADAILHLAVVVHWFNPFVWLAARAARNDCELACDERVLRRLSEGEGESYGATLLRIVQLTTPRLRPRFGLGVVTSKREIQRRIQMILSNPVFPRSHTLACVVVIAGITGLSFTSETTAQVSPAPTLTPAAPEPAAAPTAASGESSTIVYNATVDRLDHLFPTGVVATVNERTITVAEVRQFIGPLVPTLQREARTQQEFNERLMLVQNSAIKDLVNRAVLIRQFHDHREGEQAKRIPEEYVDNAIADELKERFNEDREKFLAYLRGRGVTLADYRREVEENIIYQYMRSQERKAAGKAAPKAESRAEPTDKNIRLRIIQLTRSADETDAALLAKANTILARFRGGESFDQLAREFDQGARRARGGDWGWVGASDIKPRFQEILMPLQKGEVSAPLLLPEGCFLLYVDDRR